MMEQESIYVPSARLSVICGELLGKIYTHRQEFRENFVKSVAENYNKDIDKRNFKRGLFKLIGIKQLHHMSEQQIENMILQEVRGLPPEIAGNHPMISVQQEYGVLEHEAKDALIMCSMADTVPISNTFARGLSHLGLDIDLLCKPKFGFLRDY